MIGSTFLKLLPTAHLHLRRDLSLETSKNTYPVPESHQVWNWLSRWKVSCKQRWSQVSFRTASEFAIKNYVNSRFPRVFLLHLTLKRSTTSWWIIPISKVKNRTPKSQTKLLTVFKKPLLSTTIPSSTSIRCINTSGVIQNSGEPQTVNIIWIK